MCCREHVCEYLPLDYQPINGVCLCQVGISICRIKCNQSCILNDQAVSNAVAIQINAEIKAGF